jgi:exodeoxyribonuclease VII large subunit
LHARLDRDEARFAKLQHKLKASVQARLERGALQLERGRLRMELLDPRLVLRRGYALLSDDHGRPITTAAGTHPGQLVTATLADGEVDLAVRAGPRFSP